jgi:hypothetical protein
VGGRLIRYRSGMAPIDWRTRHHRRFPHYAAATTGAATIGLVIATFSNSGVGRYVSESGVPGAPHATLYRLSIFGLAAAALLLAITLRPVAGLASAALAAAAPMAGISGSVTCSPGCPLPPYARPTIADLVHGAASTATLLLAVAAMLIIARTATAPALRRASTVASWLAVPLLTMAGMAMLFIGRGPVTGLTERTLLAATLAWLFAASVIQARAAAPGSSGAAAFPTADAAALRPVKDRATLSL